MAERLDEEEIKRISLKHAELFQGLQRNMMIALSSADRRYQSIVEDGEEKRKDSSKTNAYYRLKGELQMIDALKTAWGGLWSDIAKGPGVGKGGFGEFGT